MLLRTGTELIKNVLHRREFGSQADLQRFLNDSLCVQFQRDSRLYAYEAPLSQVSIAKVSQQFAYT